jgi:hypothetical protein
MDPCGCDGSTGCVKCLTPKVRKYLKDRRVDSLSEAFALDEWRKTKVNIVNNYLHDNWIEKKKRK